MCIKYIILAILPIVALLCIGAQRVSIVSMVLTVSPSTSGSHNYLELLGYLCMQYIDVTMWLETIASVELSMFG